jgi:hypothetical protein
MISRAMFVGTDRYVPIRKQTIIRIITTMAHITLCFSKKATSHFDRRIELIDPTIRNRNSGTNRKNQEIAR